MQKHFATISKTNSALTILLAVLFIAYCLVYLCACPSAELACAIGAELFGLALSIVILRSNLLAVPPDWLKVIPETIMRKLNRISLFFSCCRLTLLSAACFAAILDFLALCFSIGQVFPVAISLYTFCPVTFWSGLHPAVSLEMLAGALVQSREYDKAEPFFLEVKSIRLKLTGPKSDLAGAIYADLGDLSVRKGNLKAAENWYRQSVALGPRTGRGYTGLATVLRELGEYDESKQFYLKALDLRRRIYGIQSKQYQDTHRGYLKLKELQHTIKISASGL